MLLYRTFAEAGLKYVVGQGFQTHERVKVDVPGHPRDKFQGEVVDFNPSSDEYQVKSPKGRSAWVDGWMLQRSSLHKGARMSKVISRSFKKKGESFPGPDKFESCTEHFMGDPGFSSQKSTREESAEAMCGYIKSKKKGSIKVTADDEMVGDIMNWATENGIEVSSESVTSFLNASVSKKRSWKIDPSGSVSDEEHGRKEKKVQDYEDRMGRQVSQKEAEVLYSHSSSIRRGRKNNGRLARNFMEETAQGRGGMNTERIKEQVMSALSMQFQSYTWENMIDDSALTEEEKEWAKEHLDYTVKEL